MVLIAVWDALSPLSENVIVAVLCSEPPIVIVVPELTDQVKFPAVVAMVLPWLVPAPPNPKV